MSMETSARLWEILSGLQKTPGMTPNLLGLAVEFLVKGISEHSVMMAAYQIRDSYCDIAERKYRIAAAEARIQQAEDEIKEEDLALRQAEQDLVASTESFEKLPFQEVVEAESDTEAMEAVEFAQLVEESDDADGSEVVALDHELDHRS